MRAACLYVQTVMQQGGQQIKLVGVSPWNAADAQLCMSVMMHECDTYWSKVQCLTLKPW